MAVEQWIISAHCSAKMMTPTLRSRVLFRFTAQENKHAQVLVFWGFVLFLRWWNYLATSTACCCGETWNRNIVNCCTLQNRLLLDCVKSYSSPTILCGCLRWCMFSQLTHQLLPATALQVELFVCLFIIAASGGLHFKSRLGNCHVG